MSETILLSCEGSSDDTFGVYAPVVYADADYDNCGSGKPITFRISARGESMLVVGQYAPGACGGWLIGIAPDSRDSADLPIPEWPMRFQRSERPYSPALIIEAPTDVTVEHVDA